MTGWDENERPVRETWAAVPAPARLRARFEAAIAASTTDRRSRSLRPLLVAGMLVALIAAGGAAYGAHRLSERGGATTGPSPSPAISAQPSPQPTPTTVTSSWVVHHLADGAVLAMAVDDRAVYALIPVPGTSGDTRLNTEVLRIDRASGQIARTAPLGVADSLARAGDDVWVGADGQIATPQPGTPSGSVLRFDAATLTHLGTTSLPSATSGGAPGGTVHLSAGAGRLYAGFADSIYALDPSTGDVRATIGLGRNRTAQDIALAPSGDVIYAATGDSTSQTDVITEWDTVTSAQVTSAGTASVQSVGPLRLTATDTGVWASTPTGMLAQLIFHRMEALATTVAAPADFRASNNLHTVLLGNVLWLFPGISLVCADPTTAAARASTDMNVDAVTVVGDAAGTYLGTLAGIDAIAPDPRCAG